MKFSPYQLKGAWNREGALLQIQWPEGIGYADCHPWPELGDDPLSVQLEKLRQNHYTPITENALRISKLDAEARTLKKHLLQKPVPPNHFLITSDQFPKNWTHYKIKLNCFPQKIPANAKLRIDCNEKLTPQEAHKFISSLNPEQIDFVEDPCPYDPQTWRQLRQYGIPLAADRQSARAIGEESVDVIVIKPEIQPLQVPKQRVVVTSYLGHPLGQVYAAYYASQNTTEICGLLSHHAYEPTPYSQRLSIGPTFASPDGTGLGFDDLLQKEKWYDL